MYFREFLVSKAPHLTDDTEGLHSFTQHLGELAVDALENADKSGDGTRLVSLSCELLQR